MSSIATILTVLCHRHTWGHEKCNMEGAPAPRAASHLAALGRADGGDDAGAQRVDVKAVVGHVRLQQQPYGLAVLA